MPSDPINAALEAAHEQITKLLSHRFEIEEEIIRWTQVRDSLLAVVETESEDPSDVEVSAFVDGKAGKATIKFTEGIRKVLRETASRPIPISVPEIRERLTNLGFNFAKYSQPLVPIHNALKRLAEQGEVGAIKNEQGQTLGYRWISPVERALKSGSSPYGEISSGRLAEIARETNRTFDEVLIEYRENLDRQEAKYKARKGTKN
jgi:hypothetical protein